MYEENNYTYKVGIDWKDILIKIVMLVLFILLLLWLFPRPNMNVFYDNVYSQNVGAMKDAAKSYYTVDRLPKNVGEQSSMTLKEMFDNHLLIRFTDKNGKTCDESSSKVEVSKISENEYALKVQLNCGDQKDYILETIGCTSVCTNGECQTVIIDGTNNGTLNNGSANNGNGSANGNNSNNGNGNNGSSNNGNGNDIASSDKDYEKWESVTKVTYYQHKKAVTSTKTVYTCPAGYTKSGTKCTKETIGATIDATPIYNPDQTIVVDAKYTTEGGTEYVEAIKTKVKTEYSCPVGYTLNGTYCIKYTDATENKAADKYTCPTGYTLNGTNCVKTYDATYTAGSTSYSCPNGGTLNGTNCVDTKTATASTEYTCPTGYTKNGTSCYKVYTATATTEYSCPTGYTRNGTTCTKSTTETINATASTSYGSWVSQGTKYYTSANQAYTGTTSKLVYSGAVSGATCGSPCGNSGIWYKYTYYTRSSTTSYSCPTDYTRNGTTCSKTTTDTKTATASTSYSCPNGGTRSGNTCTLTATATANTTYSCPSGYTRNGTTCTKSYTATPSTGAGSYSCPNGGTLNGSKCTITEKATLVTGDTTYSCPAGYTLNGKKCEYKVSATASDVYDYSCPVGYTKEGTGVNTKCSKTSTTTKYYCEDTNATLSGTKCTKTVKGSVKYYTCPEGYTSKEDKCIKKSTITIDATAKTEKTTSYKYTWSKNSYLEGWTFTGKTKVVEEKYSAGQK